MGKEKEGLHQMQDKGPRCPTRASFPLLINAFLDPRRRKGVRLYEWQQCGGRIWDD
jgi:hypothetical protein